MKIDDQRIYELDVFRGLAAISVVLFHYTTKYSEIYDSYDTNSLFNFSYGHYGVQLFFIISGFVIFMTINKIKTGLDFVYKRFIRLYPIFWICLIITFFITTNIAPIFRRSTSDLLWNFTMAPTLFLKPLIDGAYWSLLPELLFYVFIFGIYQLKLINKFTIIGFLWLSLTLFNHFFKIQYFNVLLNLDYSHLFLMGINFYLIYIGKFNYVTIIQLISCLLVSFVIDELILTLLIVFYFILFWAMIKGNLRVICISPLIILGEISYSLYLLHQNIGYTIIYNLISFGIKGVWLIFIPLFISLFLAYFLTFKIERPIVKKCNMFYIKLQDR